jgi:hypothetical protein
MSKVFVKSIAIIGQFPGSVPKRLTLVAVSVVLENCRTLRRLAAKFHSGPSRCGDKIGLR